MISVLSARRAGGAGTAGADPCGPGVAGSGAVLRFLAFPARTTPEYAGRVLRVSGHAQHDARTGLALYEVELSMGAAMELDAGDRDRGMGANRTVAR